MKNRFLSKVAIKTEAECWEWQASLRNGYGAFKVDGKIESAHRIAYKLFVGNIPSESSFQSSSA